MARIPEIDPLSHPNAKPPNVGAIPYKYSFGDLIVSYHWRGVPFVSRQLPIPPLEALELFP